jgi:hypothetical protein
MRLWSIHPQHLDRIGLIALWREALLAKKVLTGQTKGYRHHPQLIRFQASNQPLVGNVHTHIALSGILEVYVKSYATINTRRENEMDQTTPF